MTLTIIITVCTLFLIAYLFDLTTAHTKIPSAILLLLLGWILSQVTVFFDIELPDFSAMLPIIGTVGLILIVLEGALELELNHSKVGLIKKSFTGALLPMLAMAFLLAWAFQAFGGYSYLDSLGNAIPLCIISSAIAIPSIVNLSTGNREFVIYESSLSDILGILFFNFITSNDNIEFHSFGEFGLQLLGIAVVSFVATIGLSYLLSKIEHHIKFVPVILLVILIYAVSKNYHLPALIFILVFGVFLENVDELKHFKWTKKFNPQGLKAEVKKFKELTIEATFLVRTAFFILFGFLIETKELLNSKTLIWAIGIVAAIFIFRTVQLKLSKLPLRPLLFIAPRGLITILLFISLAPEARIPLVNNSLIIQVIVLTALVMMIGLMTTKEKDTPVT